MKEYSYGVVPYKLIDNKIFVLVSKSSKISPYGFIKGKIELKESIAECSIREFKEETNVSLNIKLLEKFFYQEYKRKNIGIFLYDSDYLDLNELDLNKELYVVEYMELNYNLYLNFEKNQRILFNEISLYFKDKRKIEIKNLFKI